MRHSADESPKHHCERRRHLKFPNFLKRKYDFPEHSGLPTLHYMIACTRRSGSTMLVQHMWNTGALGAPWEYLNPIAVRRAAIRWRVTTDVEFVANLIRFRTSENGVFGYKTFIDHWQNIDWRLPNITRSLWSDKVILLRRRNIVAQAISLLRAEESQQWVSFRGPVDNTAGQTQHTLRFDKEKVDFYLQRIARQNALWDKVFQERKIRPIELWYEDFINDKNATIRMIMDTWKIEPKVPHGVVPKFPETEQQSDDVSASWTAKYETVTGKT